MASLSQKKNGRFEAFNSLFANIQCSPWKGGKRGGEMVTRFWNLEFGIKGQFFVRKMDLPLHFP